MSFASLSKNSTHSSKKKRLKGGAFAKVVRSESDQSFVFSTSFVLQSPTPDRKLLKYISYENIVAATRIQRIYRGYRTRKHLWKYGGKLMIACVVTIQRVWRGFTGRLVAAALYRRKVYDSANKIIGLFYRWRYSRFRKILRAELTTRAVVKLQSHFRGAKARALFLQMLFEYFTKNSLTIQRYARGYLGRRRYKGIKKRVHQFYEFMKLVKQMNILDDVSVLKTHPHHVPQSPYWRVFLLTLLHQFCSHNSDKSVACATELTQQYPGFHYEPFAMQFSLLCAWSSYGKAKVIREDFLEEAIEVFLSCFPLAVIAPVTPAQKKSTKSRSTKSLKLKIAAPIENTTTAPLSPNSMKYLMGRSGKSTASGDTRGGLQRHDSGTSLVSFTSANTQIDSSRSAPPKKLLWGSAFSYRNIITGHGIDPVSQFADGLDEEIEFMVFKAGVMLSGRGAVTTLLMAACICIRMQHLVCSGVSASARALQEKASFRLLTRLIDSGADNSNSREGKRTRKRGANDSIGDETSVNTFDDESTIDAHVSDTNRARSLLHESKRRTMPEQLEELTLKSDALSNIFVSSPHNVVGSKLLVFKDSSIRKFNISVPLSSSKLSGRYPDLPLSATVQVIAAGESLIIRGLFCSIGVDQLPPVCDIADKFLVPAHLNPALVKSKPGLRSGKKGGVSAKFFLSSKALSSREKALSSKSSAKGSPPPDKRLSMCDLSLLSIRPLVLLSRDVRVINDLLTRKRAIVEMEKAEKEARQRAAAGKPPLQETDKSFRKAAAPDLTLHYLIEFLFGNIRIVTCATRKRSQFLSETDKKLFKFSNNNQAVADDDFSVEEDDDDEMDDIPDDTSNHFYNHREYHGGEFGNGDEVLDGTGADLEEGKDYARWDAAHTASWRITLPGIEYMRRERNASRTEDLAIRLIQKVYRGYTGRSRYRRLISRALDRERQKALLARRRHELMLKRNRRYLLASKVQARVRGILQRIALAQMKKAALLVQTRVRGFLAKKFAAEERKRQEMGPEVKEELRRALKINNYTVVIIILRCGNNYKIMGEDLVNNAEYECYCYKPNVEQILADYNRDITGTTVADSAARIKIWQFSRVCSLLLTHLRLVKRIEPLTRELGTGKVDSQLELVLYTGGRPEVRNLSETRNLSRTLLDQREALKRYHVYLDEKAKKEMVALEKIKKTQQEADDKLKIAKEKEKLRKSGKATALAERKASGLN